MSSIGSSKNPPDLRNVAEDDTQDFIGQGPDRRRPSLLLSQLLTDRRPLRKSTGNLPSVPLKKNLEEAARHLRILTILQKQDADLHASWDVRRQHDDVVRERDTIAIDGEPISDVPIELYDVI